MPTIDHTGFSVTTTELLYSTINLRVLVCYTICDTVIGAQVLASTKVLLVPVTSIDKPSYGVCTREYPCIFVYCKWGTWYSTTAVEDRCNMWQCTVDSY